MRGNVRATVLDSDNCFQQQRHMAVSLCYSIILPILLVSSLAQTASITPLMLCWKPTNLREDFNCAPQNGTLHPGQ